MPRPAGPPPAPRPRSPSARATRRLQGLSLFVAFLLFLALVALYLYVREYHTLPFQPAPTAEGSEYFRPTGTPELYTATPGSQPTSTARPTRTPTPTSTSSTPQPATATHTPTGSGPTSTATPVSSSYTPLTWLTIYFTNPHDPNILTNGIDRPVVAEINKAQVSIDIASFDLNLPSVIEALVAAENRGVVVRVVVDGVNGSTDLKAADTEDHIPFNGLKALKDAGIPVVNGGRSSGLMHDKIIIIDRKLLFIGSWNMSYNDTYRNNNNLLRITNLQLIGNYQAKFDEMFVTRKFGARSKVGAQYSEIKIGTIRVQNYFSPRDNVMAKLIALVKGAKKSIHFYAFTYTYLDLARAMLERKRDGLDVQGVIENRGASQGALVELYCYPIKANTDGNKYTMHHKVIIIDGEIVITGSFNFTKGADQSNDDHVLIIYSKTVAGVYEQEYKRIMKESQVPTNIVCPEKKPE